MKQSYVKTAEEAIKKAEAVPISFPDTRGIWFRASSGFGMGGRGIGGAAR